MGDYTITLEELMLASAGMASWEDYSGVDALVEKARAKIFDFEYPFYNPAAKADFEKQFLLHYMFREICTTPVGRWKVMLRARLMEVMPYYSKLWESDGFEYDPLTTVDLKLTGGDTVGEGTGYTRADHAERTAQMGREESGGGASSAESSHHLESSGEETGRLEGNESSEHSDRGSTSSTETKKYSDTPQSNIPWDIDAGIQYLTNITGTAGSVSTSASGDASGKRSQQTGAQRSGTEDGTASEGSHSNWDATYAQKDGEESSLAREDRTDFEHEKDWHEERFGKGESPTYQSLVAEWRELIVEYNRKILEDLSDCFFGLY